MAELAAIGLAANILQFIGMGYSVVSTAVQVYNSTSGMTSSNSELFNTVGRLEEAYGRLKTPSSPQHKALNDLATKCEELLKTLQDVLAPLKVKRQGSRTESIRVAYQSWKKADKIKAVRETLDDYRALLLVELNLLLEERQGSMQDNLQKLLVSKENIVDELQGLKDAVNAQSTADTAENIRAIHHEFQKFCSSVREAKCRQVILKALRFPQMNERFDDVKPEHNNTFAWIFDDCASGAQVEGTTPPAKVSFTQWLRAEGGIFHVEGKAGSGKSTLMKFLCDKKQTKELLDAWAGTKQLIFGKFFFWRAGNPLQRSLKGLTQALLYTILQQAPDLIESTFPDEYKLINEKEWNVPFDGEIRVDFDMVQSRFKKLLESESTCQSRRFCFFIDGLDEFDESSEQDHNFTVYSNFVSTIATWATSGSDVKICASSRDWQIFKNILDETIPETPRRRLRLHELTRNDMTLVVEDTLKHGLHDASTTGPQFVELVDEIVTRAEGVFLWVTLVLKSLLQGAQFRDSPAMLRQRMDTMPTRLDGFLQYMLDDIDAIYRRRAATIFSFALATRRICPDMGPTLLRYSFLEDLENDPKYALRKDLNKEDLNYRIARMRNQLVPCCKGLLETRLRSHLSEKYPVFLQERVVFLHRSVLDFLEAQPESDRDTDFRRMIRKSTADEEKNTSILRLICHSFLAELKSVFALHDEYLRSTDVGVTMARLVVALHRTFLKGRPPDFEFLDDLDSVLRYANSNPQWGDSGWMISGTFGYIWKVSLSGNGRVIANNDLYGTFAYRGSQEIFLDGLVARRSAVLHNMLDRLLDHALCGFVFMLSDRLKPAYSQSLDTSEFFAVVDILLQQGATWNPIFGLTEHSRYFPYNFFTLDATLDCSLAVRYDEDAFRMLKLFLSHDIDPYVYYTKSSQLCLWLRVKKGFIFFSPLHKGVGDWKAHPVVSLRQVLEMQPQRTSIITDVLNRLPTYSEYKQEWDESCIISRKSARKLLPAPAKSKYSSRSESFCEASNSDDKDKYLDFRPLPKPKLAWPTSEFFPGSSYPNSPSPTDQPSKHALGALPEPGTICPELESTPHSMPAMAPASHQPRDLNVFRSGAHVPVATIMMFLVMGT
ncbi:uncharacterized protein PV07_03771 [Cladophialophora immunda]|uniref:Uncharacterized protein n=1 Tax=Cladophialophora immunda TaxID=569365 RepID=A0A0D1ZVK5_9EURO|nr:uncharacterized protein PV07_03771 [Cladophialophora immunda]KIW32211.1 hypothetical protein PV07_03771 [Cladophialophora immunda]